MMMTLLSLLLSFPAAAQALGPAALPASLAGLRLAASEAPALPEGSTVGAQASWRDLVRFSDAPNPDYPGIPPKPWGAADKAAALGYLGWIVQNQPGLWARAVSEGPLTMYRVASHPRGSAWATDRGVVFTDMAFDGATPGAVKYTWAFHVVLHETVHLADGFHAVSSQPAWRAAMEGALTDYRAQAGALRTDAEREQLARRLGLTSSYAAINLQEALAEVTANLALEPLLGPARTAGLNLAPDAAAFVRAEVLSAPSGPNPSAAAMREAFAREGAGRVAEAQAAYSRAVAAGGAPLLARIRRARLVFRDPSLLASAAADVAAARPSLSEYDVDAKLFYQASTQVGALSARYGEVLPDCAAAARRGIEDPDIYFNCGRSRMMDTFGRALRGRMTPEESARSYAAAAEELRRAKALDATLAPQIEPLERQLQGLARPKAPAA